MPPWLLAVLLRQADVKKSRRAADLGHAVVLCIAQGRAVIVADTGLLEHVAHIGRHALIFFRVQQRAAALIAFIAVNNRGA